MDGALQAVMGTQPVRDVDLIRHAYVAPGLQRRGIGGALIRHLRQRSQRRMLVGTWAAASWAIDFYQRHGFVLVPAGETPELLRTYWAISERQIQTSVVLTHPATSAGRQRRRCSLR
jgi:N-acetylglutamate synthase-like GNAT family acetyltransferase